MIKNIPEPVYRRRLRRAGVPVQHVAESLDDWEPQNRLAEEALATARGFVAAFPNLLAGDDLSSVSPLVGRGIALIGVPGVGKTTLLCMVLREIHVLYDLPVLFMSFPDYIEMLVKKNQLQPAFNRGDQNAVTEWWSIEEQRKRVYTTPFVALDDAGKEHRTSSKFAEDEFDRLVRARYRDGFPTGVTSNEDFERWGKIYSPSMGSFAYEAFQEIRLGGKDLRVG